MNKKSFELKSEHIIVGAIVSTIVSIAVRYLIKTTKA